MQQFREVDEKIKHFLKQKNKATELLDLVEDKTKIKKLQLVYGAIAAVGLYLIFGFGSTVLANFIGFLYPAYASIKAIESKTTDDDTKWLTYWVVFAGFSLVEVFADILLFWIPLYSLIKCALFLFLMAPCDGNGSVMLYKKVIKPYFLKYEAKIDQQIDKLESVSKNAMDTAKALGDFKND